MEKEKAKWLTAETLRVALQVLAAVIVAVLAQLPPDVAGAAAGALGLASASRR